jgi:hypothetical protein
MADSILWAGGSGQALRARKKAASAFMGWGYLLHEKRSVKDTRLA